MWRFVRHIAFDMFAWGADQSGLWLVHGLACVASVSLPLPFRTPATQAIHGLTWDQALFFIFFFFFASLFLWPEREKITPSSRKQITEIKGEGMIAGYPRLCAYTCAYNISISTSTRRTNLSVFLVLILMLMSTQFSLAYTCACAYVYAYAYALVKTRL